MLNAIRNWWLALRYPPQPERRRLVAEFRSKDGAKTLEFFERNDGFVEFEEHTIQTEHGETFWAPTHISGLYSRLEEAEAAASAEIPWMRDRG